MRGCEGGLEFDVVGHFFLCLEPLVQAQEHISGEAICSPVTTSLNQKWICTQAVEVGGSAPTEAMATVAAGIDPSSI